MPADASDVEALEIKLLLEAIYCKYGYDLRGYSEASMRRRVLGALARSGRQHLGELQHELLCDPYAFAHVLESLTVQVSEMFRDPAFFKAFRQRIVPFLKTYPSIRIWSSGCATGEEAYTLAILLTEEGLYDRCQIYATDLSANALEDAKQGVYPLERVAVFAANYAAAGGRANLSDYYASAYGRIAMKESLKRNILFFPHNLVSDYSFAETHVVLCRNVMIYFGDELRRLVLRKFSESLCPGGFLCLGASERLSPSAKFAFADFAPEARIYRHEQR